jgi:hypothetical protein
MKHTRHALRLAVPAAVTAAFFLTVCPGAFAQKRPKSVDTSSNVQVAKRTVKRPTTAAKPVNVARTGLIMIGPILENAKVFLNDKPAKDVTVDAKNNRLLVDDVPPGPQKVTYDAPDYVIVEKTIPVRAGNEYLWIVTPKPALATLVVRTLPDTAVFVDNEPKGRTPASGSLTLNDVRLGQHEIKLVKDAYVEFKRAETFEFERPVTLDARLEPVPNSAEFSDLFDINLKRWTVPASGWTLKGGRLQLANAALGYPTGVHYRDIEAMAFHLRLENGGGAAWALRAKDPNNYYLFYLSGPKGLFPGYFNTYVVKDGKFDPQDPVSSSPVVEALKQGGEYQITIRAVGNLIEHEITPASTGQPIKLGVFEDPNNTFVYGGLGFRTVGSETFSVDELFVQPK